MIFIRKILLWKVDKNFDTAKMGYQLFNINLNEFN